MSQQILEWSLDGIRIVSADASGRVNQAAFWESFEHHDSSLTSQELGEKTKAVAAARIDLSRYGHVVITTRNGRHSAIATPAGS